MVESDDIGKSLNREAGAGEVFGGEAAQALHAILQTQYLRYVIIGTWALGLLTSVGFTIAALWFVGTVAAGDGRWLHAASPTSLSGASPLCKTLPSSSMISKASRGILPRQQRSTTLSSRALRVWWRRSWMLLLLLKRWWTHG